MYLCDLMIDGSENLGKAYGVLTKRRADILGEEIKEGSYVYSVQALLPAVESIGFVEGNEMVRTTHSSEYKISFYRNVRQNLRSSTQSIAILGLASVERRSEFCSDDRRRDRAVW